MADKPRNALAAPIAEMRPTPRRNALAGYAADAIGAVDRFARAPFGYENPPVAMISDALDVPAIQRTLERYSYGEPLTNIGKANVPLLPQDTAATAMALAPIVAKWPRQSAVAALGLMGAGPDAGQLNHAMNISFVKGGWTDKAKLLANGEVQIPLPTRAHAPMGEYRDKAFGLAWDEFAPKYGSFWRFTNNKNEPALAAAGKLRNSINHGDGIGEVGLSVAESPHYGIRGYSHGYQVQGEIVGYGSDGEPLLNPATLKVVGALTPSRDIVAADTAARKAKIAAAGLPDDYMSTFNFLNSPADAWK